MLKQLILSTALLVSAVAATSGNSCATDLEITLVEIARSPFNDRGPGFNVTLSWENAWHYERNLVYRARTYPRSGR